MYMADVIAFFFSGRFNWIRKMRPERSVIMSLILGCLCRCDWFPDDAARAQALDFFRVEPEFLENFIVVFAKIGRAPCRYFCDAVHLNRTADRELYVFSGTFQRNDDVVGLQLRILDNIDRIVHQTVGYMSFVQDFAPMCHRL